MSTSGGGLVRPDITAADAVLIMRECYGFDVTATELGSNQDRNFLIVEPDGSRSVLRIDNEAFSDAAREAQHAAIDAYRAAGVAVAAVLPGLDGALTQRWNGFAVRRSEFAAGEAMVDGGYFAPVVLREFGALSAASVNALAALTHPGLDRQNMWDMRVAPAEVRRLAPAIADAEFRRTVLEVAADAAGSLEPLAESLPTQAIHGDLTDDNVMGLRGDDSRLHPHTVLDLGDLATGWRVAELAVTVSSMLHHEADRPLRALETITAFHRAAPLSVTEARALWPLVVLRASLLVASGWRQLEIDGENEYARERMAGEQAIFSAATAHPLGVMTEAILAELGLSTDGGSADGGSSGVCSAGAGSADAPEAPALAVTDAAPAHGSVYSSVHGSAPLAALIPGLNGEVVLLDPGVESAALDAGAWLAADAETSLVADALDGGAAAAVLPYGVYRLTRAEVNSSEAGAGWPADTEIWIGPGAQLEVTAPLSGSCAYADDATLVLELDETWRFVIHGTSPMLHAGDAVIAGAPIGVLGTAEWPRRIVVGLRRFDAPEPGAGAAQLGLCPRLIEPELVDAWRRFSRDPASLIGLPSLVQHDESAHEQARRERIFARAQERYYETPMQIERGWRHHLIDTTARSYVDMVNNVTGLGHGHPGVADAVNRQIRLLNTNSRFLYRELAEYSERILSLLPAGTGLDTVLLVNSGSEAVDLALRLAQAATGRRTVVALREAYHGWTMASDAVTTSAYDNPSALLSRPSWVHISDVPNPYRGTYRGAESGERYVADLDADLNRLNDEGNPVAGFICESVLGNAGGVLLPDGYLSAAYERVRTHGGLCIADEVQVDFGRMGSTFWGFEHSGVVPDLITIAKPMGNGFPIGAVITSQAIADALTTQGQFFSSAGGNPLSCRVGLAVLDAMEAEGLQENARVVGERLRNGFERLARTHELIGHVHGQGLYLGVELVRDRVTLEPATAETAAICERLRELGVIMLPTSERSNVLKVKPPLCLTEQSADFVLAQLDRVLAEGW